MSEKDVDSILAVLHSIDPPGPDPDPGGGPEADRSRPLIGSGRNISGGSDDHHQEGRSPDPSACPPPHVDQGSP
jgi:hypothetical protein